MAVIQEANAKGIATPGRANTTLLAPRCPSTVSKALTVQSCGNSHATPMWWDGHYA